MPLMVTRTTSGVLDLFLSLSPKHDINSNNGSGSSNSSLWLWTAVGTAGMGVVGFKLCRETIGLVRFCAAWNEACRRNRTEIRYKNRRSGERLKNRRLVIERSLTTLTYEELRRRLLDGGGDDQQHESEQQQESEQQLSMQQQQHQQQHKPFEGSVCLCARPDDCTRPQHKAEHQQQQQQALEIETTCAICLVDFEAGDSIGCSKNFFDSSSIPKDASSCKHIFHTTCLQAWLIQHASCPVCRGRMVPEPLLR